MRGTAGASGAGACAARRLRTPVAAAVLAGACALAACSPRGGGGGDSGPPADAAQAQIETLFADYLRLHAAKDMTGWQALFLPEAIAVEVERDEAPAVYPIADLARSIAEYGRTIGSQHETLEQVSIDTHGGAGACAARYTLYIDGENVQSGRAFFSLVRRDGLWRIAALVWQVD